MTLTSRIRFIFGLLAVFLTVGLLVLYLNNAMSTVKANEAELGADTTSVGTDYPGLVSSQTAREGERVRKGQALFTITSAQLASNIDGGFVKPESLPFDVEASTGEIEVVATDDGVIEKINFQKGSYTPGGVVLATINTAETSFISASFNLTPPDYARVKKGNVMNVTFPDNSKAVATVYNVSLTKDGDIVDTVVKARLQSNSEAQQIFTVGTPVEASLKLVERTWYQNVSDFARSLVKPASI